MKNIEDKGFSLSASVVKEIGYAQRFFGAISAFVGLGGCLWVFLGFDGMGISPFVLLAAGFVYCAVFCGLKGKWNIIAVVLTVSLFVYFYAAWPFISEGWNVVLNQIFQSFEAYLGRILPRYAVEAENQLLSATMFLVVVAAALGALCGSTAKAPGFSGYLTGLLVFTLGLAALIFTPSYPIYCVGAVIAAVVLFATRISLRKKLVKEGVVSGGDTHWQFIVGGILLLLSVLLAFPLAALNHHSDQARLWVERSIDSYRYDGGEDTAPEGDFSRFPLTTSMSDSEFYTAQAKGDVYYLKGYVGEVYTGDTWLNLESEYKAEYAELFSWLHDRKFFAQSQYSTLTQVLGRNSGEFVELKIANPDAYSKYTYAPYEVTQSDPDRYRIGDENILADGFWGEREYEITFSEDTVSSYEILYSELDEAFADEDADAIEYLKSENAYRDFVYENYLEIPDMTRAPIQDFLGGYTPPPEGLSFDDAKSIADQYISSLPYADQPENTSYEGDFVTDFLSTGKQGNSLHFSTAGTLLFRYLGVPARYVEGYIVTENELEAAQRDGMISLDPQKLRGWIEIYRDGIGFVPFELDSSKFSKQDQVAANQASELETPEDEQKSTSTWVLEFLVLVLPLGGILLVVGFMVLAIRRFFIRRRYEGLLSVADNRKAISFAVSYLIRLVAYAGLAYNGGSLYALCPEFEKLFGQDMCNTYSGVISTQQKALFSDFAIKDGERAMVVGFLNEIEGRLKKHLSILQYFKMKWVDCVL